MLQAQIEAYGDVLVLDSTARTNTFKMPLVVVVGIDAHKRVRTAVTMRTVAFVDVVRPDDPARMGFACHGAR